MSEEFNEDFSEDFSDDFEVEEVEENGSRNFLLAAGGDRHRESLSE